MKVTGRTLRGAAAAGAALALLVSAVPAFAQQAAYLDSNIVTVKTLSGPPPIAPSNNYSVVCAPLTGNSVYVGWTALTSSPAAGSLYYAETGFPSYLPVRPTVSVTGSGNTSFTPPNNNWPVWLQIEDSNGTVLSNNVGNCYPAASVSNDAPTRLNIFTNGPTAIYLNWKDNSTSTATSTFELQRFQVTPGTPSNVRAAAQSGSISLTWKNNAPNNAPFYTLIERSTNSGFSGSLATSTVANGASTYTDSNNLQSNTTYYYRLTNVSQVPVQSYYQNPGSSIVKPNPPTSGSAVGSTFYSGTVGFDSIRQALGNMVGWLFTTPTAEGQTSPTIDYNALFNAGFDKTGITTPSYLDSSLSPGTVYMYRVRLTYPQGGASTWANMAAGVTMPSGAQPVSGGAPICTAYAYCNTNVTGYGVNGQFSESQCTVNADCRDVGRSSQAGREQ